MTREEALKHIDKFAFLAISDAISLVNKIFDDLEVPKTCDGCEYNKQDVSSDPCDYCLRSHTDEFTPKASNDN